jgi:hypothetical protein
MFEFIIINIFKYTCITMDVQSKCNINYYYDVIRIFWKDEKYHEWLTIVGGPSLHFLPLHQNFMGGGKISLKRKFWD